MTNKTKKKVDLYILVLIIIGMILVVNFFSYQLFVRWDLTQGKEYSISNASKISIGKLDDVVNIKVYFSKNLPSQYLNVRQEVGDILDEYQNYSKGKIKVEFIDPKDDEEGKREMYAAGIPELQFNSMEKDKYQIVKGYMGMVISYGDKKEPLPVVQDTNNFEYQVTLAIKKVTSKDNPVLGYITSNSTANPESELKTPFQELQKIYTIQRIDLKTEKEIPSEVKTLLIVGPKERFTDKQLVAIDKFLMEGKSLLVLLDSIKLGEGLIATPNSTGLEGLLNEYGIKANGDLVMDASAGNASFSQGYMTFMTPYPLWPKIIKSGFDANSSAVAKLESITLPWTSSLEINDAKIDKNAKISYLVKSSNKSAAQTSNFNLNPQQDFFAGRQPAQYNLALAISGKLNSPYRNGSTDKGRITVVGDSSFIRDNFLRNMPDNMTFFQNLVDSMSLDEDLINIRSKGISERPLKELSDSAKVAIRYSNILGLTIIIIGYGMIRYYLRRKSRFVDEL